MFRFTVWGLIDEATPAKLLCGERISIYLAVHHAETIVGDKDQSWRATTSQLTEADIFYPSKSKRRHVGGTFVERLAADDRVTIALAGESNGFVYSSDGGGPLTFRGELIAPSNFDA